MRPDSNPRARQPARRVETRAVVWRMSQPTPAFLLMTVVSTVIASYGLLSGSAAVVIGAMLIAPLMGPILGVALGVAIGDTLVLRRALAAEVLGVLIAVALSAVIGLVPLQLGYGAEIISRTKPTLYDLIIALAAGVAAAYAVIDERVSPTLPGVAIATALVPPLAACGLCVAGQRWSWAAGAFLLFVANFLAITTVGAATFLAMGVRRPGVGEAGRATNRARRLAVNLVALVVVGVHMTQTLVGLVRDNRLSDGMRRVLQEEVSASLGAQLSEVRHERRADGLEVVATVLTARPFEADSVARMQQALRAEVAPGIRLIVRSIVANDSDALGPVFVLDEEKRRLSEEAKRTEQMGAASAALTRELVSAPGASLVDLSREPGGALHATVRTPVPLGPALVAEAEAALRQSLGEPVRLVVQSVLVRTADAKRYVDEPSGTAAGDEEAMRERERWAALLQAAAGARVEGARVAGLQVGVAEGRVHVDAVLHSPASLAPSDVGSMEEYVRPRSHPAVELRVRSIVGAVATPEGYGAESEAGFDLTVSAVPSVRAPRSPLAEDPVLALCVAATEGDLARVKALVENGADPHAPALLGSTPLHYAARSANPGVVTFLLERGADPTAANDLGETPLDWASTAGRAEAVHLLGPRPQPGP